MSGNWGPGLADPKDQGEQNNKNNNKISLIEITTGASASTKTGEYNRNRKARSQSPASHGGELKHRNQSVDGMLL